MPIAVAHVANGSYSVSLHKIKAHRKHKHDASQFDFILPKTGGCTELTGILMICFMFASETWRAAKHC